jgi:hypothetical protein
MAGEADFNRFPLLFWLFSQYRCFSFDNRHRLHDDADLKGMAVTAG